MREKLFWVMILWTGLVLFGFSQTVAERGKGMLERSDALLYPFEGSFVLLIQSQEKGGPLITYELEGYKKGKKYQTVIWRSPAVNLNDVGLRSGEVIYYKPAKWPKADMMSYLSLFMGTGFSWGDVLVSDIAEDYEVTEIREEMYHNQPAYYLRLKPLKKGLYARLDTWLHRESFIPLERVYYTPSGEVLKKAVYSGFILQGGKATGFTVDMVDMVTETTSKAIVSAIREEKVPQSLFDPQNIHRIRVRGGR
ncbi:MAG: outer membrane lipoprotein-sorting protein [Brevinematales bacterium]|nr:outer membrane lipoprotein-sorting protein [Brevinematales bacterium]